MPDPVRIVQEGAPALWKVSSDTGTAWIFGTVHLLPPDTNWQTAAMDEAIRQADQLVLEAAGLDDGKAVSRIFSNMGVSGGNPPIARRIDPSWHPAVDRLDDSVSGGRKMLDHMESWAAALTLAGVMSADLGLSEGVGVESVLTLRFRAESKPVAGLETITEQFGFFDTLPEAEQRTLLNAVLRGQKENRVNFERLLTAWLKGDANGILKSQNDGILASPVLRETLLDGRNRNWTAKIATMLDKGQRPFVAVGAAHVAGEGGVPALLEAKGYKVERVQ